MSNIANRFELFRNKKKAAEFYRNTAKLIETLGWVQGEYGSQAGGFCLTGALCFYAAPNADPEDLVACNMVNPDPEEASEQRKVIPTELFMSTAIRVLGREKANRGRKQEYSFRARKTVCYFDMVAFNDHPDTTQEDVTRFLRGLARHLEHGGSL